MVSVSGYSETIHVTHDIESAETVLYQRIRNDDFQFGKFGSRKYASEKKGHFVESEIFTISFFVWQVLKTVYSAFALLRTLE